MCKHRVLFINYYENIVFWPTVCWFPSSAAFDGR